MTELTTCHRAMVADLPRVLGAEPRWARPRHPKGETEM